MTAEELRLEVAHIFARLALGSRAPWLGVTGDVPLDETDLASADAAIAICMKAAAEMAAERAAICFDARDKIMAGELYQNLPRNETAATEQCAGMEARYIAHALRLLSGSPA